MMSLTGLNLIIFCIGAAIVSLLIVHVCHLLLADRGNGAAWACMLRGRPSMRILRAVMEALFARIIFEIFDIMRVMMGKFG